MEMRQAPEVRGRASALYRGAGDRTRRGKASFGAEMIAAEESELGGGATERATGRHMSALGVSSRHAGGRGKDSCRRPSLVSQQARAGRLGGLTAWHRDPDCKRNDCARGGRMTLQRYGPAHFVRLAGLAAQRRRLKAQERLRQDGPAVSAPKPGGTRHSGSMLSSDSAVGDSGSQA